MAKQDSTNFSPPRQRSLAGRTFGGDEESGLRKKEGNSDTDLTSTSTVSGRQSPDLLTRMQDTKRWRQFWRRFTRAGRKNIGVMQSLRIFVFSSWLNIFIVFTPIAWVSHFASQNSWPYDLWSPKITFVLCFVAMVPYERMFEYCGEQMAFYIGHQLGDLLIITLNNMVEATLAIILLLRCELKLLQSTIVGIVFLHLLFIPGVAFVTGGARILEQELHPQLSQLNHTLLTVGTMALLIPAAFFAALDRGVPSTTTTIGSLINDQTRGHFLKMSRGLAVILHLVYIASRVFVHNPPGEEGEQPDVPEALKHKEQTLIEGEPEVNQYVCIAVLLFSIAMMAATAEWLVESIDFVRSSAGITEEWFGLILLPLVSVAADGFVAIFYFVDSLIRHFFRKPQPPAVLAKARSIDLSIQFILFWMPFLVQLGWWTGKPMHLLFDFFEVAILLAACFIVNYVTADAKTNWVEGYAMVSFYVMIALCSWFYTGQPEIKLMDAQCESVLTAVANLNGSTAAR